MKRSTFKVNYFFREECAIWCQKIGIRCVRWVYVEKGTTCYIKSLHGDPRTKDDPLTEDDKVWHFSFLNLKVIKIIL